MPPKRKRVDSSSDPDAQPSKKQKIDASNNSSLQSLPTDCLSEILGHLPPLSRCAASLSSKRFNDAFEAFISRDLVKRFGASYQESKNLPQSVKTALYPRWQYLSFENLLHLIEANEHEHLEKLLRGLRQWIRLQIYEKLASPKLEELQHINKAFNAVVYKDLASKSFNLWDGTDSDTSGGHLHMSFFLIGQSGRIVEVSFDVTSFNEHSGGTNTCDLTVTPKLMDGKSSECTEIDRLLEGYKAQMMPDPSSLEERSEDEGDNHNDNEDDNQDKEAEDNEDNEDENEDGDKNEDKEDNDGAEDNDKDDYGEDSENPREKFKKEVKSGDRVKVNWWHDCYPKLNHEKLTQVLEWLDWKMSTKDLAKLLVGLCLMPDHTNESTDNNEDGDVNETSLSNEQERSHKDIDTSNTKASLEAITKLVLNDEDEWLNQVERTLDLLTAKMKLKNRIRNEWKKKSKSKLTSALTLIDRSMYSKWNLIGQGILLRSNDPDDKIDYKLLQGGLKLINEDPSKWVHFKFNLSLCRDDPDEHQDDLITYSFSTPEEEGEDEECWDEPWTMSDDNVKLIKDELGLDDFTDEEIVELLAMAVDLQLKEISLANKEEDGSNSAS